MSGDSWAARLYQTIRNYLPWPTFYTFTPPLRCKPVDTDSDIEFYSDLRYLEALAAAVLDDVRLANVEAPDTFPEWVAKPLLAAASIPVESRRFWTEWDWPVDHAGTLISLWKLDNEHELSDWINGTEAAA